MEELLLKEDLAGKIDELSYQLNILSNKLGVKGIFFNNLKVLLDGDLEKLNLNEFSFKYLDNLFYSKGYYDILNNKYLYDAEANDINLDF